MSQDPTIPPTLLQRLNAVRKAVNYIQKDKSVSAGASGSYKAVTHDAVTGILREHLIEQGVLVFTTLVDGVFHMPVVNVDGSQAKQRLYDATFEVTFMNVDNRQDSITIKVPAHALDNGDKAPGKAISYATKYALLKTFNIETGEDEESRYQQNDYDFAEALTRAEAAPKELALEILVEAKSEAVRLKDKAAIAAIAAVGKKLSEKFAKLEKLGDDVAGQA